MSDSLSHVRKVLRHIRSEQRKALRKKMNSYNALSKKSTCDPPDYDLDGAKTTQDVIAETLAIRNGETTKGGRRFSVSHTRQDKLFQDASIVQPEVRSLWHEKCNMVSVLSEDVKRQMLQTTNTIDPAKHAKAVQLLRNARERDIYIARERTLDQLARWMVYMWCDAEGYDPDKHPK